MSVIEEAAKRLQQLQRAGIQTQKGLEKSARDAAEPNRLEPKLGGVQEEPKVSGRQGRDKVVADEKAAPPAASPSASGGSRQVDLDLARLAERRIITPDAPRSRTADEFRVIKRPLIANASLQGTEAIKNGNLVLITSALPGEGKSFTAINLAMSIAMELDRTVLLVDADVARPSIPDVFGLPETRGLLDLLVDDSIQLGDVLISTNVEKLSILSGGTKHDRATELLASDAMIRLLDEMARRYADRIIVFDSPPLLVTTEARVLAAHMGQVVLVVQADGTSQAVVKHALSTIEACSVKQMLLNKARTSKRDGYGYGYGYGYGS